MEQVLFHQCKGWTIALFTIGSDIDTLNGLLNFQVQEWLEPGLGMQRGFNFRLPNEIVVHAEECVDRPDLGVAFYVDSCDVESRRLQDLIDVCIDALCMSPESVTWRLTVHPGEVPPERTASAT